MVNFELGNEMLKMYRIIPKPDWLPANKKVSRTRENLLFKALLKTVRSFHGMGRENTMPTLTGTKISRYWQQIESYFKFIYQSFTCSGVVRAGLKT